jgi:hypothetical protein
VRSDQLVTVLSAAIFVFVGVDSNHFRYVLDFEVTVQGLFGDYQGALLIILSIFDWNVWMILVLDGLLHPHSSIRIRHTLLKRPKLHNRTPPSE